MGRIKFAHISVHLSLILLLAHLDLRIMAEQQTTNVTARNAFSNRLYQCIAEEHGSGDSRTNLIFSPYSLETVLCVAGLGARGTTKDQMSKALGYPLEWDEMRERYSSLLSALQSDAYTLRVATSLFVHNNYPLVQNFVNGSMEVFSCGLQSVDFIEHPAEALSTINGWVEEKTEHTIKELLTIDAITEDTRLVLANAIYFKGKWAHPFDKHMTKKSKFNVGNGVQVDVDMMYVSKRFNYGRPDGLDAQVLELPYEGEKLSMVLLLPDENSSLRELEAKVSAKEFDLHDILRQTSKREVMVYLPKFKLELTTNLEDTLRKLGMTQMFTDAADFSGITSSPLGLKVSKVVQKAFIEVTEEGTEASAATGMVFVSKSARRLEKVLINKPFIYILQEPKKEIILFCGRFLHPPETNSIVNG